MNKNEVLKLCLYMFYSDEYTTYPEGEAEYVNEVELIEDVIPESLGDYTRCSFTSCDKQCLCWVVLLHDQPECLLDRQAELGDLVECLQDSFEGQGLCFRLAEYLEDQQGCLVGFGFITTRSAQSAGQCPYYVDTHQVQQDVLDCNPNASLRMLDRAAWALAMRYCNTTQLGFTTCDSPVRGQAWP